MTNISQFQRKFMDLCPNIAQRFNEPLSKHTSFRIGGPAEVMAFPKNLEELSALMKVSRILDCKPVILGAGTNILAPDEGISGLVICLKDSLSGIEQVSVNEIWVAGGVTMTRAAVFAAGLGLGGLEFAHGIPGTVGGGVYMNAGAYDGQLSDCCRCVEVMDLEGNVTTYTSEQMEFSYRHSRLEDEPGIVISATFALEPKPESEIRERMRELMSRRKEKQPLELPSAGSTFKRPEGHFAGALIEQAGLKGFCVGDACVSEKHAGFVVNLGGASSEDVKQLIKEITQIVYDRFGVMLEPEIRIW